MKLFNATERKGILFLLILITGFIILPRQFRTEQPSFFYLQENHEQFEDDSLIAINNLRTFNSIKEKNKQVSKIELNCADSLTLISVRGIGPYYSSRILQYRKQLGGYYCVEQLNELNMRNFDVNSSIHLFEVDTFLIKKMDFDSIDFKTAVKHPYLEYKDVEKIFRAKKQYGKISFAVLQDNDILSQDKLKKLKPYCK